MPTLWSGRFDGTPDEVVFRFGASFDFDRRLFEDDITGSIAWIEALECAGVVSSTDKDVIVSGLREILKRGLQDPAFVSGEDEDVHSFVERQLVQKIGDTGKRLHTGRSRNEQVSLDLRLYLKRRLPVVQKALLGLLGRLADCAGSMGSAVMPAYTHMRRAQPVLAAHFFLAHAAALRRDYERYANVLIETDTLPLGSGAVAGTNYPIDTKALATRLGFSRIASNSIDASADRDFVSTFLYVTTLTMVHLSRVAEDLILFTSEEFGFFELADDVATGSSLMPQKKNPDPLELVRGKSGRTLGHLTGWLMTMKGLPSGYNKDLQEDKEAIFDTEETVLGALEITGRVVSGLTLNRDCAEASASGLLLATEAADYLVKRGMPFRQAHEVIGRLVRWLTDRGRDFDSLSLEEWQQFSDLFNVDVQKRVTTSSAIESKCTPQSTNPDTVSAALSELRVWLGSLTDTAIDQAP